jgi:hypothetical protein
MPAVSFKIAAWWRRLKVEPLRMPMLRRFSEDVDIVEA